MLGKVISLEALLAFLIPAAGILGHTTSKCSSHAGCALSEAEVERQQLSEIDALELSLLQVQVLPSWHGHLNSTGTELERQQAQTNEIGLKDSIMAQLEYELHTGAEHPRSKLALALLELTGLAICGLDRCYMGQYMVGTIKGMTLGGLLVWYILDYIAVVVTCLSSSEYINAFGMKGQFLVDETGFAFWVMLICLIGKCCLGTKSIANATTGVLQRPSSSPNLGSPKAETSF